MEFDVSKLMLKNSGEPMRSVTPAALDQCCQLVHMPGPSLDISGGSSNLPQLTMVSLVSSKPHRIFGRNSLMTFAKRSSKELLPIVHGYSFKHLTNLKCWVFGIVSNMYSDGRSIFYPDYHESSLFLPMKPTVKNS